MNMLKILAELQRLRHSVHPHIAFNYVNVSQLVHEEVGPFDAPGMPHSVAARGAQTVERTEAIRLSAAVTATDNSPVVIANLHRTERRLIEQLTANAKGKVTVTMQYNGWDGDVPKGNRVEVWTAYMRVAVDNEAQHNTTVAKSQAITKADVYHPRDCQHDDTVWSSYVLAQVQQFRASFHAVPRENQVPRPINVQGAEYGSISFIIRSSAPTIDHIEMILRAEDRHHLMRNQPQQCLNYMWRCTINDATHTATWCASTSTKEVQDDDASAINERLYAMRAPDPYCNVMHVHYALSRPCATGNFRVQELVVSIPHDYTTPAQIANLLYEKELAWRVKHPQTEYSPIVWTLDRGIVRTYTVRFYVEVNNAQE